MQLRPWPILSCSFLIAVVAASAQTNALNPGKLADMDAAIDRAISDKQLPGAVLWLQHGSNIYHHAYGSRALEPAREVMTENTIFDAASLTKVLATAPAAMLLLERQQLSLDQTVQHYLPAFRGDGKEAITIRQLLTHTSGLRPGIGRNPPWQGYETAIQLACDEKLAATPGTVFRYSDINFFVLGDVIQRITGMKLEDFVSREIYQPLKMVDTQFHPPAEKMDRIAPTERSGDQMLRGTVHDPTARLMGGVAGHAGLFTTAADMARYAQMLLNLGQLEGTRILQEETVRRMTAVQTTEPVEDRRGFGWDIDTAYSRPRGKLFPLGSYGHTGFTGTAIWIDPFSKSFWIFLSNRVHPDGRGSILGLQQTLATLAAEAVPVFDFARVEGELPARPRPAASVLAGSRILPTRAVSNGIDVLVREKFGPLKKLRLGLITNQTGVDRNRRSTIDLLHEAPDVELRALFSPEHGIRGVRDEQIEDSIDTKTGLKVYSLYGARRAPDPSQLVDLDALVFDIQDIGCRFYTYIATMGHCLEAAARAHLKFFVLDRVNPINGLSIEGPVSGLEPSFTAYHSIPLRHGMTVGELARMFNQEKKLGADLTVIAVEGWARGLWFDQTELPWINPSPNMRNLTEAILYPGVGLHETALSVGRGTDTPFEVIGAPYVDDLKLCAELNQAGLPGIRFVPVRFTPTASVFQGKECGGANLIVTERDAFNPVETGLVIALVLERLYPQDFALSKLDTLLREPTTIDAIRARKRSAEIKASWAAEVEKFRRRRQEFLLY